MSNDPLTVHGLLTHVEACLRLKTCYFFGGMGRPLTLDKIDQHRLRYPSHYTDERCSLLRQWATEGVYGFDCSGLIKSYWFGGIGAPLYKASPNVIAMDLNAGQMLAISRRRGPTKRLPEEPGLALWLPGHVGVYMGGGRVIESTANTAFGDGVTETRLADRPWTFWFQLPFIRYEER